MGVVTNWRPELSAAFYPGATREVAPETQQRMHEIPSEILLKTLQEVDDRITSNINV